jgi:Glycosyltransferase
MSEKSKIKVAITGIRGIPSCYSGFETFAEELSTRLVKKGYDFTVYCRSNIIKSNEQYYKGVRRIVLPTISSKYLDTIFHTFLCIMNSLFKKYDIILICNAANSIFSFLPRIFGKKVVVNVDGIERKRKKWNIFGKLWYLMGEVFSCIFPNAIISDAKVIQDYYYEKYKKKSFLIAYGTNTEKVYTTNFLKKFGIKENDYFLYVSRLEPENNAHIVIKAFEQVKTDKKLVIIGGAPYAGEYIKSLKNTEDDRIVFTGFLFGVGYKEFQSHAYCYVQATEVGGTHPALIEAMGFGNCIIANETPENVEVLGDCGLFYNKNSIDDLKNKLDYIIKNPGIIGSYKERSVTRVKNEYSWDSIVEKYEKLFTKLLNR